MTNAAESQLRTSHLDQPPGPATRTGHPVMTRRQQTGTTLAPEPEALQTPVPTVVPPHPGSTAPRPGPDPETLKPQEPDPRASPTHHLGTIPAPPRLIRAPHPEGSDVPRPPVQEIRTAQPAHHTRRRRSAPRLIATLASAGLLAGVLAGNASAVSSTPAAAGTAAAEEIINGDFASGATAPWWSTANNPASVVDGRLCADVPAGTANPWDAIIGQNDLAVTAGETYAISYTASATSPVTVTTNLQQTADPFTQYFTSSDQLTAEPKTFSQTFTAQTDDAAAGLQFQIGGSASAYTFCVDDVSLTSGAEVPPYDPDTGSPVRVNQVGYLPDAPKKGVFVTDSTSSVAWSLKDASGTQKASGTTTPLGVDKSSGQNVQSFDFSSFTAPGDGYTVTIGDQTSEPFYISDDIYSSLRTDALQYFYVERSGIAIDGSIVGNAWARPAGHVNVGPNQGDNGVTCVAASPCDYTLDVAGGWYDAGDQGKYVVNGGIATSQLLSSYERTLTAPGANGAALGDGKLRVPEHGNGVPDILDEARWELRVPAGACRCRRASRWRAWRTTSCTTPSGPALPTQPTDDDQPRELHPPSTAATLNLAAAAAQGARLFKDFDPAFSAKLLAAAKTAYDAAVAHPAIYASATDGTGGGTYDDKDVTDEFYWAAAELFITTGDAHYRDGVLNSPLWGQGEDVFPTGGFSWGSTAALGALDLATVPNGLTAAQRSEVRSRGHRRRRPVRGRLRGIRVQPAVRSRRTTTGSGAPTARCSTTWWCSPRRPT